MTTFETTYPAARAAFLAACAATGGELASYRHPLPGPDGEPLFLDTARFGPPDARRVLFVASGTHGVEGFCGSGIQRNLIDSGLARRLAPDVALVLIHGVNPWGFAWLRRVNEDNVDVNRNFVLPGEPLPANEDYDRLYDALNPSTFDDDTVAASFASVAALSQERGPLASYRALSGGQYRHPRGVQYGGAGPVWSNRTLRAVWERHAGGALVTAFVDLHSGLGPAGTGMLLQTAPADSVAATLAATWWPDVVRADPATGDEAALVTGLIGPAFVAAHPHAAAVGLVLEMGTKPLNDVMLAVVAENWLAHHGDRASARGREIAAQMRDAFLVDDDAWRDAVCARARQAIDAALDGLAVWDGAPRDVPFVRPARADDLDVLVGFAIAMARETEGKVLSDATLRPGIAAALADPERGRFFVVEDDGAVAATLMLTREWSDWRNGWFWWIQNVYVGQAYRRRGHYRRLHAHVEAMARHDPTVCGIRLYVEQENHAARTTYAACGMAETHYRLYEQPAR